MAEYWDIYDADRQKKRGTHLRGKPLADGDYHLAVSYTHLTLPTIYSV